MDEWASAIMKYTTDPEEVDELFDRALVHNLKFKDLMTVLADTRWVVERFPKYTVSQLVGVITDADTHNLLPELRDAAPVCTSKQELVDFIGKCVRSRIGIGNILLDVLRPSILESGERPCLPQAARQQVDELLQVLFPDAGNSNVQTALRLMGVLSRLDEDHVDAACEFLAQTEVDPTVVDRLVENMQTHRVVKRRKTATGTQSHVLTGWETREPGIHVFTDGALQGSYAGYAVVFPEHPTHDVTGKHESYCTNTVELYACLVAVKTANLINPSQTLPLHVHTDSLTAVNLKNASEQGRGSPAKGHLQTILLEEIAEFSGRRQVNFVHIKAHSGGGDWRSVFNAVADQRAKNASRSPY